MIVLNIETNARTGQLYQRVQFDSGTTARVYGEPTFRVEQMEALGEFALATMKARAQAGIGVNDAPMPPLKESYARYKQRKGGSSTRDLTLTGDMLAALSVRSVSEQSVRMDMATSEARIKADANDRRAEWYGFSPHDIEQVDSLADQMFGSAVDEAMGGDGLGFPLQVPRYQPEMLRAA